MFKKFRRSIARKKNFKTEMDIDQFKEIVKHNTEETNQIKQEDNSCPKCSDDLIKLSAPNTNGLWCKKCHIVIPLDKKGNRLGVYSA